MKFSDKRKGRMRDKYGVYYRDYTCIPRRMLEHPLMTKKHILLYDLLWNTVDADRDNMESGEVSRADVMERLGIDKWYLDRILKNLITCGFIERNYNGRQRSKTIQVSFLAEPKKEC